MSRCTALSFLKRTLAIVSVCLWSSSFHVCASGHAAHSSHLQPETAAQTHKSLDGAKRDHTLSQQCSTQRLFPRFAEELRSLRHVIDTLCSQSDFYNGGNIVGQRMHILRHVATQDSTKSAFRDAFNTISRSTRVKIVIGSYQRPANLMTALQSVATFTTGCEIAVSYHAGDARVKAAYDVVLKQFSVQSLWRSDFGGYMPSMLHAVGGNLTNVIVASDDTMFVRPFDCTVHGTLQRLLSADDYEPDRVTTQLRMSYETNREPITQHLMAPGLPHVFSVDCRLPTPSVCYDRHIDGPMFPASLIQHEWPLINPTPQHPGELEGNWMALRDEIAKNGSDTALVPADQFLINVGMDYGTVRDDRMHLEAPHDRLQSSKVRKNNIRLVLQGCFPVVTRQLAALLNVSGTHTGMSRLEWNCNGRM